VSSAFALWSAVWFVLEFAWWFVAALGGICFWARFGGLCRVSTGADIYLWTSTVLPWSAPTGARL
jgi:hypothetical protein